MWRIKHGESVNEREIIKRIYLLSFKRTYFHLTVYSTFFLLFVRKKSSSHLAGVSCFVWLATISFLSLQQCWPVLLSPWSGSAHTHSASGSSPPCCRRWCCPSTPAHPASYQEGPYQQCPPLICKSVLVSWSSEYYPESSDSVWMLDVKESIHHKTSSWQTHGQGCSQGCCWD